MKNRFPGPFPLCTVTSRFFAESRITLHQLHINSWHQSRTLGSQPFTHEDLLERLEAATEVTGAARTRLVRRILARCAASVPLRTDIDPSTFVSWLTNAGAVVALSAPGAL